MRKVYTPVADLYYDEDSSVLQVNIVLYAEMNVRNLDRHYQIIAELTKGAEYMALIDVKNSYSIFDEGIAYASKPDVIGNRLAAAYISPSLANRLQIMDLQRRLEPIIPTKIFPTKDEALSWLQSCSKKKSRS